MRRRVGVAALALIGTASAIALPASPASAFTKPPQNYGGYSSGVETFANLAPALGLAKAQVADARSAAASQGLTPIVDELGNSVSPANPNKASQGFGAPLELNVLNAPLRLVAPAQADAPPSSFATGSLLNLPIPPLASVNVLPGEAAARFNDNGAVCIIGADLARGRGAAANVSLLNNLIRLQATEALPVSTISRQLLTAQVRPNGSIAGPKLGVESEVVQHVVPATIADPAGVIALRVEVAGDVKLRAFAGGLPGTSFIEYTPPPVLRLTIPPSGLVGGLVGPLLTAVLGLLPPAVQALVPFNPVTGVLQIPLGTTLAAIQPLVNLLASLGIVIGEQPRAIGSTGPPSVSAGGTSSSAAIDLVRIRPAGALAALAGLVGDVRVGHMEVAAFAPAGGVDCPGLGVAKTTDRDPVQVGESFVYTITATNPYDCTLTNVRVQDDIVPSNGVTFTVGASNPKGAVVTDLGNGGKRVVFANIGDVPPRGSRAVQLQLTVDSATGNGRITDTATVTATCATGGGTGTTNVSFNLTGTATLNAPQVGTTSANLARTGRNDSTYLALALSFLLALAGVEVLRRRSAATRP